MKLFKSSILAMLALAAVAITSCDGGNDVDYTDGVQGSGSFFPTTKASYTLDRNETSFTIPVARQSANDPSTVEIVPNDTTGFFGIPTSVTFNGESLTADLTITYDPAQLEYDKAYGVDLIIKNGNIYGNTNYSFTVVLPGPWKTLGKGLYTDELMIGIYNVEQLTYDVTVEESELNPGLYRIVNPYGVGVYPYTEAGDMIDGYGPEKPYYMYIHAEKDDQVYFERFSVHMIFSDDVGELSFTCRAAELLTNPANTIEAIAKAGYCGNNRDGVIYLPTDTYFQGTNKYNDGWYGPLGTTGGRLVLPGIELTDYSAEISYTGRFTDVNEQTFIMADVTLGDDVVSARVAAAQTTDVAALQEAIENDEIEYIEISQSGEVKIPVAESGRYTVMVVTYANGEVQEVASTTVEISLGGNEWEKIGNAYILDGWMMSAGSLKDNYDEYVWMCPIERSTKRAGIYRLVQPYGPDSPMGNFALPGIYNIEINAEDPGNVFIEPQSTGNGWYSNGVMIILSRGYITPNLKPEYRGVFEDGTFYFPAQTCLFCFDKYDEEGLYMTQNEGIFQIDYASGTSAKFKAIKGSKKVGSAKQRMNATPYDASRSMRRIDFQSAF
ncbi:MAG: hypothetical protein HDS88_06110 [Bacteroidales bacterium]|nr:hypothetical protein [Bacteroidales bacterium]MBD5245196.1 hypothetical protein [Barnesiella sp.]